MKVIKPIKQTTWTQLKSLRDDKLQNKLSWLNHTGHSEAFEEGGRLYYRFKVTVNRSINEIKEVSTMLGETGVQIELKRGA